MLGGSDGNKGKTAPTVERRVLTAKQASDYLGVTYRYLVRELTKRPVSRGGVGFIRPKGSNRYTFFLSDLDAWLERWHDPNGGGR